MQATVFGKTVDVDIARYHFGNMPSIQLIEDGEPYLTASVNPPTEADRLDAKMFAEGAGYDAERAVVIKDYSENAGVLDALVEAGVVIKTYAHLPLGWVQGDICVLTDAAYELLQKHDGKERKT